MKKIHYKKFINTPFHIEIEVVKNSPGTWNSNKIGIFRDNKLIGEYIRNYHAFAELTFYPFQIMDEWYALYSADYRSTRVMRLYDDRIEDWCGEDASASGFCPVEMYIPKYNVFDGYTVIDNSYETEKLFSNAQDQNKKEWKGVEFCDFGFLCGCIWGDDSSWKIRYIDLAKIPNKILSITEKFGYWEMPRNMSLKKCVDMTLWEPDDQLIILTKAEYIRL